MDSKRRRGWKSKIVDLGQRTGTKEHARECYEHAIEIAKREDVTHVYLNRGMNRVLRDQGVEVPRIKANTRADVTYVTKDGRIHQIEVRSKMDRKPILDARMENTSAQLPKEKRGRTDTKDIAAKHKPYE